MRLSGALCAGSDAWFPDNNRDWAVVVELCRTACPAYRECLEFAMSGVALYGVVAGLNMGERDRMSGPRVSGTVAVAACRVCGESFEFVRTRHGRNPMYCSQEHRRAFRSGDRQRLLALAKATA